MACTDVFQALKMSTESLGKDIHRKATNRSVWLNALPKGTYPLESGLTQTTFRVENSLPVDDELAWEKIATTTASGNVNMDTGDGLCVRSWNDVEWGMSEQTYSPERISIRGPQICKENLKYRYNVSNFFRAYLEEISKHSKRILENKLQNEYMKVARQVTISGVAGAEALNDVDAGATEITGANLATSVALLPGHLDQLAIKLIESGATEGDSNGWVEMGPNGPVFPLIIGMEASNKLLKDDAEVRTDYRESSKSNELLAAIGADRVTGNFRHIVVTNPARFKLNATPNGYDRVSENVALSGASEITRGSGTKINPLYTAKTGTGAAAYEAAVVLVPSVMKQLVVPSSVPGNLGFSADSYSGDWNFVTGAYKFEDCEDPTESFGRHIGSYEMAFEPIFGDHGATLLFAR
jgi:hypothetical protein